MLHASRLPTEAIDDAERVLVAVHDASTRDTAVATLMAAGHVAVGAASERDAVVALESPVAVVIIDADVLGSAQLSSLVQAAQRRSPPPCWIALCPPTVASLSAALRLRVFGHLEMPLAPSALVDVVGRAVGEYRAARRVEHQHRRYEALFETVPGVVFFITEDGVFQRVNEEGARLLGYEPAELRGTSFRALLPPAAAESDSWVLGERRTASRATRRRRVELLTRSGERRTFEMCSTGVPPGSEAVKDGTLGVGWDITDQLLLQDQLRHAQKMDAVGRIAAGVAHDFNNILQVILANARLLRGEVQGDEPGKLIADVLTAAKRGAGITRQLLMFSREQRQELAAVDLGGLVAGMRSMIQRLFDADTVFQCNVPGAPVRVHADRGHLEQVLMNLAINARDATAGGGSVTVTVADEILDNRRVARLIVEDTGMGMADEVQRHLFEPFFTTKAPERGTGLGLAAVYGIVAQHGGTIAVRSAPGAGATFTVTLPWFAGDAPERERTRTKTAQRGGEAVLVVEDEPLVRRSLVRSLERQGYRVTDVADGVEAISLITTQPTICDLVITDVRMPRMNGAALAAEIRAVAPALPILFISGHPDGNAGALLREHTAFVEKPVSPGALLQAVRDLLDTEP